MEQKIQIGDKINLIKIEKRLSVDPEKKLVQYNSKVLDEGENGHYYISMPIQEGKLIPFSVGQEFEATFLTKSGLLRSQIIVCGRFKKGELFFMEIELTSSLTKVQRREFFRFSCRIPMEYRVIEEAEREIVEPGDAYYADEVDLNWKNGVILDLSGGGVRFVCGVQEKKYSLLQVRFQIEIAGKPDVIYTYARLLRIQRNENQTGLFDVRLEFWRMDQGTREKIIRYIFEEQRKNRSKQLGLD